MRTLKHDQLSYITLLLTTQQFIESRLDKANIHELCRVPSFVNTTSMALNHDCETVTLPQPYHNPTRNRKRQKYRDPPGRKDPQPSDTWFYTCSQYLIPHTSTITTCGECFFRATKPTTTCHFPKSLDRSRAPHCCTRGYVSASHAMLCRV